MGFCGGLSVLVERGCASTQARFAVCFQRVALYDAQRLCVALLAKRLPALGDRLPADSALAQSGHLRDDGARPASGDSATGWARTCAKCRYRGLAHALLAPRSARPALCSTCESGPRAGYDGAKKRSGSKVHIAVDTLGHLLALSVTPADQGDRTQVEALCEQVQEVTGESVQLVWVDQGYTGDNAAQGAAKSGIELHVIKLDAAKRGFVLLPRRWVVERSFAWANRFRRLVKDYERLPETLRGLHFLAFACLMVKNLVNLILSPNTL